MSRHWLTQLAFAIPYDNTIIEHNELNHLLESSLDTLRMGILLLFSICCKWSYITSVSQSEERSSLYKLASRLLIFSSSSIAGISSFHKTRLCKMTTENSTSTTTASYEVCGGGCYRFQVDGFIHFMVKRSPSIRYFKTLFVPAEEIVWLGDKTNCHFLPANYSGDQEEMLVIEETQEKISNSE